MAKIAVELEHALRQRAIQGTGGQATPRIVARGEGWTAADVVCTSGPRDRRFEEQHASYAIAVVVAGSFQYRSTLGGGLMTPGSLMLGTPGVCYECGHEYGSGDRCVVFWYEREFFERLAADAAPRRAAVGFTTGRLPALRELAPFVSRAAAGVSGTSDVAWEELGIALAARVARLGARARAADDGDAAPPGAWARVTQAVRAIDRRPASALTLTRLAREAGLSPYHFLRTFQRLAGVTPHQYILRARLREATQRLADAPGRIVDIALDCGFGDVSNFNRAFRTEFGVSPRAYRSASREASVGYCPSPQKGQRSDRA